MHIYNIDRWEHSHRFHIVDTASERSTIRVVALTAITMIIEIAAGLRYGSMALLADGWHMATHVAALAITVFAYRYARQHENDPRYSFGTGKVGVLGGFASAVALAVVALLMAIESILRLLSPQSIQFNQAILVAIIGLAVNLICAFLLRTNHQHDHIQNSDKPAHHHDYNLRAAYFHVIADALTSFLAIFALSMGKAFGWIWMDSMMGIVGGALIARWSYGLLRDTSQILLDSTIDQQTILAIRSTVESDSDNRISDLHIWRVGSNKLAAIVSIVTHYPKPIEHYQKLLSRFKELEHLTVEIYSCSGKPCLHQQEKDAPLPHSANGENEASDI